MAGLGSLLSSSSIDKLITERGSAGILRERLTLLGDQLEKIEDENRELTERNRELERENTRLRNELEHQTPPEGFVEAQGILLRRLPSGQMDRQVYCPGCRRPMFSLAGAVPFYCGKCGFTAGFTGADLPRILSTVK